MTYAKLCLATLLAVGLTAWAAGCNGTSTPSGDDHGHEHGEPGHEHKEGEKGHEGHDHAAHGPHEGHIIEIGDEEYHAEWTHDDSGKVTVYILDSELKKEVPIAAETITIDTVVNNTPNTFKLDAVNPSEGDLPKASQFEIVDKGLLGVLESLSKGVTATLKLTINDKPYEAPIVHDDHGHKH
jgi:hypothetical protein